MTVQARIHPAVAGQHYRSLELASRVGDATPHGLVALLYEELLRSLDVIIAEAGKGVTLPGNRHTIKARSILVALEASLDFDHGGDLALVLAKVYRATGREFAEAVGSGDEVKLKEVREAVSTIAYSWASLTAA
ncbi:flagellar protein FliS [Nostoc sp. HG1]|nr:flagellar protein FliS [Nostoc sp. HG1]